MTHIRNLTTGARSGGRGCRRTSPDRHRRGNILVLTVVLMVAMMAVLALSIDLGYLYVARNQLQRTADSAAIAAAWELIEDEVTPAGAAASLETEEKARSVASKFAALNTVLAGAPTLAEEDVTIGYLNDFAEVDLPVNDDGWQAANAVRVRVRRTGDRNGEAPLFFARVLGLDSTALQAEATAAIMNKVAGFEAAADGSNIHILPFALDIETWNAMLAGGGSDNWRWDPKTGTISSGADGVREVNLYPQGTGSPGNRGTVDIGGSNNSTADISRQITDGISEDDFAHHGGKLEFDENGELDLNGDTGISAGVKDELASIKGEPRIIPIFNKVVGPGNNANYTIVKFVGVRILDVKLTGSMSSKRVIIQPANIVSKGGIPAPPSATTSDLIYSPAWLLR